MDKEDIIEVINEDGGVDTFGRTQTSYDAEADTIVFRFKLGETTNRFALNYDELVEVMRIAKQIRKGLHKDG